MANAQLPSQVNDYYVKARRLIVPISIVFNATPANKVLTNDLPDSCYIAAEGLTAAAAAVDAGTNFTTPVDATGIFGVLIANQGVVKKLLDVQVVNINSGTATVARVGASSNGVTASGNIAVSIDSSLSLAAASLTCHIVVDFLLK